MTYGPSDPIGALRADLQQLVYIVGGRRAFARQTGVARTTLQDILGGRVTPSARTIESMLRASYETTRRGLFGPVYFIVRAETTSAEIVDRSSMTLERLVSPAGAQSFRMVVHDPRAVPVGDSPPLKYRSTPWVGLDKDSPAAYIERNNINPGHIERVLYDIGS